MLTSPACSAKAQDTVPALSERKTQNNPILPEFYPTINSSSLPIFALKKAMNKKSTSYITLNPHRCVACWKCIEKCPKQVIGKVQFLWHRHVVFKKSDDCIGCKQCIKLCPNEVFTSLKEQINIQTEYLRKILNIFKICTYTKLDLSTKT